MPALLEKALEKVVALPQDEQDAIASQILASLADEGAWKARFAEKRDVIRRMAREALEEDARGGTLPLICFDAVADHTAVLAVVSDLPLDAQRDAKHAYRLFQDNPAHPGLQFRKITSIRFASV